MRSLIPICLVIAVSPALAQDQEPPTGGAQEAPNQDPPAVSDEEIEETIAMVRDSLELCREAQANGNLEEARLHVRGALEVMQALDGLRDAKLLASLEAIDGRAGGLGLFPAQLAVREWTVGIRENTLPADHPDLLAAEEKLAVTRHELRDIKGAHGLFEHVHAARERLLPADHPDLLGAKMNLAATRQDLGELESALELVGHVHAVWERLLPPEHPDLLRAKVNLASTRWELGDLEGAREL